MFTDLTVDMTNTRTSTDRAMTFAIELSIRSRPACGLHHLELA